MGGGNKSSESTRGCVHKQAQRAQRPPVCLLTLFLLLPLPLSSSARSFSLLSTLFYISNYTKTHTKYLLSFSLSFPFLFLSIQLFLRCICVLIITLASYSTFQICLPTIVLHSLQTSGPEAYALRRTPCHRRLLLQSPPSTFRTSLQ